MKEYVAVVVQQPYADMIASGEKTIENRTWSTSYRGDLAIVAGRGTRYLSPKKLATYRTGCVVCVVSVVECVPLTEAPEDIARLQHAEGPYCWVLADPRPVQDLVPVRGRQRLFRFRSEVLLSR